eukprot:499868-Prorocentrum_lima.AAC.1
MDRQPSRNAGVNVSGQSRSAGESVMAACGTGVSVWKATSQNMHGRSSSRCMCITISHSSVVRCSLHGTTRRGLPRGPSSTSMQKRAFRDARCPKMESYG